VRQGHTESGGEPFMADTQIWARMGAHPHGTIRGHVDWTPTGHKTVPCDSGPVTFTLHR
jgi:hypothetical protein